MAQDALTILQPGAVFHGRYRVVRSLRVGGMGAVYEVLDEKIDGRRALKVMLPSVLKNADLRARFALEAKITGSIESDHVVRVSDAGIDDATGTPFLVMELLQGEELADIIARRRTLPPGEVVLYLRQAALALDKTHAAGIVHRDLKPENLFVTHRDDGSRCVKILDFGVAKLVKGEGAQKTRALGTPIFMAPEQIKGVGAIGPRADLYTIGHIAYAALAGEPYWAEDAAATEEIFPLLQKIVAGAIEPASARARRRTGAALPAGFDAWFHQATAVRPEDRFEQATTMIGALVEALGLSGPAPVSSSPGQPWTRPAEPPTAQHPPSVPPRLPANPETATPAGLGTGWPTPAQGSEAPPPFAPLVAVSPTGSVPSAPVAPTGSPPGPQASPTQPAVVMAPQGRGVAMAAIIALAVVALAAIGMVVFRRDDRASATGSGPPCYPRQICRPMSLPDPAHADASSLLPNARAAALAIDGRVRLAQISATDTRAGLVDLVGERQITYLFNTPDSSVYVFITKGRIVATPGTPSMVESVDDPQCSLASAWRVAAGAGISADEAGTITYTNLKAPGTVWHFGAGGQIAMVDGATCALKSTSVRPPAAASSAADPRKGAGTGSSPAPR